MGEDEYSKKVRDKLIDYGKYKKVYKIRSPKKSVTIRSPINPKHFIVYKPDLRFILNDKRTIVFEILDSQIETKTISDIVRCIFHDSVTNLFFIVKTEEKMKKVHNIARTIMDNFDDYLNLEEEEEKRKEIPLQITTLQVSPTRLKNKKNFFKEMDRFTKGII